MKRSYLAQVKDTEGNGYEAIIHAKNLDAARDIDGVEYIINRVDPKEKAVLMSDYGVALWATNPKDE